MSTTANESAPSGHRPLRKVSLGVRRAIVIAMYYAYVVAAVLRHISRTHHSALLAVAAFAILAAAAAGAWTVFRRTGYWTPPLKKRYKSPRYEPTQHPLNTQ